MDEFRADGSPFGSVIHDFMFLVTACDNTPPDAASGTVESVEGGARTTATRRMEACAGTNFCATLNFTDADADQQLSLTSTVAEVLPGATLQFSGTNELLTTLCWDVPGDASGTLTVLFNVTDNACPVPAQQTYTLIIDLLQVPSAGSDTAITYCPGGATFALIDSLAGGPSPGGTWTDPFDQTTNGSFVPGSSPDGIYRYTQSLFPGCSLSANLTVAALPAADPACSPLTVDVVRGTAIVLRQEGATLVLSGLPDDARDVEVLSTDGRLLQVIPTNGPELRTDALSKLPAVVLVHVRTVTGVRSTHRLALLP